jgi:hypothetical protein
MTNVTFRKVHCQVRFCQSVEEIAYDLEMFLKGATIHNCVVNVGLASLKVLQKGMKNPLKGGWRVFLYQKALSSIGIGHRKSQMQNFLLLSLSLSL